MPQHFPSYMAVLLSVGTLLPFTRHCTIHAVETRGVPSSSNSFWISTGQERLETTTSKSSNSFTPVNRNIKILSLHHYTMYWTLNGDISNFGLYWWWHQYPADKPLENDNMIKYNTTRQSIARHRTTNLLPRSCINNYINNYYISILHNNQNYPKQTN